MFWQKYPFTRDKYKAKTGIDIDIQTAIEQPEIHILTKTSSSIDDQLLHSAIQLLCIKDITSEIELPHGRKLIDKQDSSTVMTPVHNSNQATKKRETTFAPLVQLKQQRHIVYINFTRKMLKPWKWNKKRY